MGVGVGRRRGKAERGDENAGGLACLAQVGSPGGHRPSDFVRASRKMLARLELGWKSSK